MNDYISASAAIMRWRHSLYARNHTPLLTFDANINTIDRRSHACHKLFKIILGFCGSEPLIFSRACTFTLLTSRRRWRSFIALIGVNFTPMAIYGQQARYRIFVIAILWYDQPCANSVYFQENEHLLPLAWLIALWRRFLAFHFPYQWPFCIIITKYISFENTASY